MTLPRTIHTYTFILGAEVPEAEPGQFVTCATKRT